MLSTVCCIIHSIFFIVIVIVTRNFVTFFLDNRRNGNDNSFNFISFCFNKCQLEPFPPVSQQVPAFMIKQLI